MLSQHFHHKKHTNRARAIKVRELMKHINSLTFLNFIIKIDLKVLIYEKLNIDKGMDISWESAETNKNPPFCVCLLDNFIP